MPWWFWPLAIVWLCPVLWVPFMVAREIRADRRVAAAERRSEAMARSHLGGVRGSYVADEDVFTAQTSNPRRIPRADHWRI